MKGPKCKVCFGEHPGEICPVVKEAMQHPRILSIEVGTYGQVVFKFQPEDAAKEEK